MPASFVKRARPWIVLDFDTPVDPILVDLSIRNIGSTVARKPWQCLNHVVSVCVVDRRDRHPARDGPGPSNVNRGSSVCNLGVRGFTVGGHGEVVHREFTLICHN